MWVSLILILLAAAALTGVALRLVAVTPRLLTDVWTSRGEWAEARLRHCEGGLASTGIPVEPWNAYSSLAYLGAGWLVWIIHGDLPSGVVAGSLTLLALGSAMYHGTKAKWAARLDHAGMYAVFGSLAIYCVAPSHPAMPWVMLAGAAVFAVGFAAVAPGDLNARMGILLALMSIRGFLLGHPRLSGWSVGMFGLAMAAWLLDRGDRMVLSRFGHAIWHLATAAAIALMYAAVRM